MAHAGADFTLQLQVWDGQSFTGNSSVFEIELNSAGAPTFFALSWVPHFDTHSDEIFSCQSRIPHRMIDSWVFSIACVHTKIPSCASCPLLTLPHTQETSRSNRNLANYGYQIPESPDQVVTPSIDDSIRSMQLHVSCGDNQLPGASCEELIP